MDIPGDLGGTAEGGRTTRTVWKYASVRKISVLTTEAVYRLFEVGMLVEPALKLLVTRPPGWGVSVICYEYAC